jgi:hypothetical protein
MCASPRVLGCPRQINYHAALGELRYLTAKVGQQLP